MPFCVSAACCLLLGKWSPIQLLPVFCALCQQLNFFAPFARWVNLQQVCIMSLVFYTAGFFEISEWVPRIGFTSTLRSQRSLQVVTHAKSTLFTSIQFCPSLESEEGVEGYGGLEGLQGCEGLVLGAWLRSGAWSCVLIQHTRVPVQVAVHRGFPVALIRQDIIPEICKI